MPNYTTIYIIKRETTAVTCLDLFTLFDVFDPKNSITPAGVTDLQWVKIEKKFFFIFGIRMTQFAKKSKKKILTQNLVLECLECGPKKGQNDISGGSVIHHLNCLAKSFLNMKFQPKIFTRSRENTKKPHFWA